MYGLCRCPSCDTFLCALLTLGSVKDKIVSYMLSAAQNNMNQRSVPGHVQSHRKMCGTTVGLLYRTYNNVQSLLKSRMLGKTCRHSLIGWKPIWKRISQKNTMVFGVANVWKTFGDCTRSFGPTLQRKRANFDCQAGLVAFDRVHWPALGALFQNKAFQNT